jgi:hypothetical protein
MPKISVIHLKSITTLASQKLIMMTLGRFFVSIPMILLSRLVNTQIAITAAFILNGWALQDFLPKLKAHLLPEARAAAQIRASSYRFDSPPDDNTKSGSEGQDPHENIIFKHNRLYLHNTMRINYTTYDVRRAQDTINTKTSKRDIMVLPGEAYRCDGVQHPYVYARVLGVFHANVIYTSSAASDYLPIRLNFLWVRWFRTVTPGMWDSHQLEQISFPPMADKNSFGFLDPKEVVRSCHIIPKFASGKVYSDGIGLSLCSRDSDDYRHYYVGR